MNETIKKIHIMTSKGCFCWRKVRIAKMYNYFFGEKCSELSGDCKNHIQTSNNAGIVCANILKPFL